MAKWVESDYKLTQGSTSIKGHDEAVGVTGTNYGRDCELSRHGNWYLY